MSTPLAPGVVCSKAPGFSEPNAQTLKNTGTLIRKYAMEWSIDTMDIADVVAKVKELVWLVTVLYGVGGLQLGKSFLVDFVTYAPTFLSCRCTDNALQDTHYHVLAPPPPFLTLLTPHMQGLFLHTYLSPTLAIWIARDCHLLSAVHFYTHTSTPHVPAAALPPDTSTLNAAHPTPNP